MAQGEIIYAPCTDVIHVINVLQSSLVCSFVNRYINHIFEIATSGCKVSSYINVKNALTHVIINEKTQLRRL